MSQISQPKMYTSSSAVGCIPVWLSVVRYGQLRSGAVNSHIRKMQEKPIAAAVSLQHDGTDRTVKMTSLPVPSDGTGRRDRQTGPWKWPVSVCLSRLEQADGTTEKVHFSVLWAHDRRVRERLIIMEKARLPVPPVSNRQERQTESGNSM